MKKIKNCIALSLLFSSTNSLASLTELILYDPLSNKNKAFFLNETELESVVPGLSQIVQLCDLEKGLPYEIVIDETIIVLCTENGAYIDLSDFDDLIHFVPLELSSQQQNGIEEEGDRL